MKGQESGHTQTVKDIAFDCDGDTLLIQAEQIGAACHEGYKSCFFRSVEGAGPNFKTTEAQPPAPGAVTPAAAAPASTTMNGAAPVVPTGTFDNRWSGFR